MYILCNEAPHIKKSPRIYEMNKPNICPVCGARIDKETVRRSLNMIYGNFFSHEGGHIVSDNVEYLMAKKRHIFNYKQLPYSDLKGATT